MLTLKCRKYIVEYGFPPTFCKKIVKNLGTTAPIMNNFKIQLAFKSTTVFCHRKLKEISEFPIFYQQKMVIT